MINLNFHAPHNLQTYTSTHISLRTNKLIYNIAQYLLNVNLLTPLNVWIDTSSLLKMYQKILIFCYNSKTRCWPKYVESAKLQRRLWGVSFHYVHCRSVEERITIDSPERFSHNEKICIPNFVWSAEVRIITKSIPCIAFIN